MNPSREDKLIHWLRSRQTRSPIGDDAAILKALPGWTVTLDQQISGIHFPRDIAPELAARRLFAVSASDLAAMGARPRIAFLALAAPGEKVHRRFLGALNKTCADMSVVLAGGDMARDSEIHASLTLLGQKPPRSRWLRRSNAKVGDRIWLGGSVGQSAVGRLILERGAKFTTRGVQLPPFLNRPRQLSQAARAAVRRHLVPTPQLDLGVWLGHRRRAAAIDISDGLALDLHRLCRESGVGAEIRTESIPGAPGAEILAPALGATPLELMLAGGEDYVLLFTLPAGLNPPPQFAASSIGTITDSGVTLVGASSTQPLEPNGWDHLRS